MAVQCIHPIFLYNFHLFSTYSEPDTLLGTFHHHRGDPITRVIPCWVSFSSHSPKSFHKAIIAGEKRQVTLDSTAGEQRPAHLPGLPGWNKNGWSDWPVWSDCSVLDSWPWALHHPACMSPRLLTPQGNLPHHLDWPERIGLHLTAPEASRGPRKKVFPSCLVTPIPS